MSVLNCVGVAAVVKFENIHQYCYQSQIESTLPVNEMDIYLPRAKRSTELQRFKQRPFVGKRYAEKLQSETFLNAFSIMPELPPSFSVQGSLVQCSSSVNNFLNIIFRGRGHLPIGFITIPWYKRCDLLVQMVLSNIIVKILLQNFMLIF